MYCRGTKRRGQIVEEYNVAPKAHIKLLAGQEKISDAGGKIEKEYYIFEATPKKVEIRRLFCVVCQLPRIF